ncbi:MAG: helix-turn-helix domain-containing protein, partial [Ketobacteraceae bacterium]|nr:helix-turn-helix domain-containing protein [Ketobacteraceae bacterium]
RFSVTENMHPFVKRFYLECAISGSHTFLKQFLKTDQFQPVYRLEYPEPEYKLEYTRRLGPRISFGQTETGVTVKRQYFERNDFHGNRSVFKLASQQCEMELAQLEKAETIVSKIKLLLMESPWLFPTQEQIAARFSMSQRTLRRKLNEAGTTYQAVIDSVRESLAKEYLQNSQWTVNEIADLLGYSETNNFIRAFKRWSGHTPADYRQQYRQSLSNNLKRAASQ